MDNLACVSDGNDDRIYFLHLLSNLLSSHCRKVSSSGTPEGLDRPLAKVLRAMMSADLRECTRSSLMLHSMSSRAIGDRCTWTCGKIELDAGKPRSGTNFGPTSQEATHMNSTMLPSGPDLRARALELS